MATKKKVKTTKLAKKSVTALNTMKKYPAPKWSRDLDKHIAQMLSKSGYQKTDKDRELERRTSLCYEGAKGVSSNGKDYLIHQIWYAGYKLAVVVGRKKKATKSNNGLEVVYILQRNLKPIPAGYEEELAYLYEDLTQQSFSRQAELTLRMSNADLT